jgi:hypothetical protein
VILSKFVEVPNFYIEQKSIATTIPYTGGIGQCSAPGQPMKIK